MKMSPTRLAIVAQKLGVEPELLARCHAEAGLIAHSEATKASWRNPETRAKRAAGVKRAWAEPERRTRNVEAIRESNRDPALIEKRRTAAQRRYAEGSERARLAEQGRRAAADAAVAEKKSAAMKARRAGAGGQEWTDRIAAAKRTPESRGKMSAAMKAAHARKRAEAAAKGPVAPVIRAPRPSKPVRDARSEAEMVAEATAAGRVTKCPTAAVGATTATIDADDRRRIAAHTRAQTDEWHAAWEKRHGLHSRNGGAKTVFSPVRRHG